MLEVDATALALSGGEDYELLATLPADAVDRAREDLRARFGVDLSEIGEIVEGSGVVAVDADGRTAPLEPSGWDHFAQGGLGLVDDHVRPPRPRALSIAGSDSGGGAGSGRSEDVQRARRVRDDRDHRRDDPEHARCERVPRAPPEVVGDQIRAVVTDIGVDAAKTGMLASAAIVHAVAEAVAETAIPNLVVDPVSVSKHGHRLLDEDAVGAVRERILPLATLVTPNLPEAAVLAGFDVTDRDLMQDAAETIRAMGPEAVLVKGGHLRARPAPTTCSSTATGWRGSGERIETPNTHGTGCTLSSAIAAHLARGDELLDAVRKGKAFVTEAIRAALPLGSGSGPSISCGGSRRRGPWPAFPAEPQMELRIVQPPCRSSTTRVAARWSSGNGLGSSACGDPGRDSRMRSEIGCPDV